MYIYIHNIHNAKRRERACLLHMPYSTYLRAFVPLSGFEGNWHFARYIQGGGSLTARSTRNTNASSGGDAKGEAVYHLAVPNMTHNAAAIKDAKN